MRKLLLTCSCLVFCLCQVFADDQEKFSPEKFQAQMEQFITQEANLTSEEASKFFPLLREMYEKQRLVYDKIKKECRQRPSDEAGCKKVVLQRDLYELELKTIQQSYHKKFFNVLKPSKVYDVLKAEDRFHRKAFKNWSSGKKHSPKH